MTDNTILVLTGPTATGKTALSIALAERFGGEIVSADSMQLYRGMDIGTAKVTKEEMRGIPHHLIDVADPADSWSVARWCAEAEKAVSDILSRRKRPILVGGTGLYIDSLLSGRDFSAESGDSGVREELSAEYDSLGGEAFREKLRAVDPERAERLAPADKKRLVRALEVYTLTGETITAHDLRTQSLPPRWPSYRFALTYRSRETLYERIRLRVDKMMEKGLLAEVQTLLANDLDPGSTAMQAIGYKELAVALRGECTVEEAVETIKRESCRYAKRQLTWLRRDEGLHWLEREDCPDTDSLLSVIFDSFDRK